MPTRSRVTLVAALALLLGACGNGQLIDASGKNGGGGLAFVAMALMVFVFVAILFFVDKVRSRDTDE